MNRCPRPLDPIDVEALASGAEPSFAADAAAHAAGCAVCGASVERARVLTRSLDGLARTETRFADLAARVTRLRAFSRRERRTYAFWRAPVLLSGGLAVSGLAFLVGPALTAPEQAGLGAAAIASVLAFLRSVVRWAPDLARVAPSALEGLSEALAKDRSLGLVSLLLLLPAGFALTRVFARARSLRP